MNIVYGVLKCFSVSVQLRFELGLVFKITFCLVFWWYKSYIKNSCSLTTRTQLGK